MRAHSLPKPTAPEVIPMMRKYAALPGNNVGGSLHIVLDDGNVDDGSVLHAVVRQTRRMKITIKAEAQVPYTSEVISQDIVIELYHAREKTDKQILWAAHEVENIVIREVDKEMEKRGIKLGPDGLRLPNS